MSVYPCGRVGGAGVGGRGGGRDNNNTAAAVTWHSLRAPSRLPLEYFWQNGNSP